HRDRPRPAGRGGARRRPGRCGGSGENRADRQWWSLRDDGMPGRQRAWSRPVPRIRSSHGTHDADNSLRGVKLHVWVTFPAGTRAFMTFANSTVVVTGASAGNGRATARAFAKRGARVALIARGEAGLKAAHEECLALGAQQAIAVPCDMADADAVEAAAERIK